MDRRIYGPVPSRRFGLSLGVDLVPLKTCTLNCVYCQLGPTLQHQVARHNFYPADQVLLQIREDLETGPAPDVLTFAGSGEPTLYADLGTVASGCREISDAGLLLITNGTLLHRADVSRDANLFDMVAPSLDAGDVDTWRAINGPEANLDFDTVVQGIVGFSHGFKGRLLLEVFFLRGGNDSDRSVQAIADLANRIAPDRVDLNTVARPTPGQTVSGVSMEFLESVVPLFSAPAAPIRPFPTAGKTAQIRSESLGSASRLILETLARRPCTFDDLCTSLGLSARSISAELQRLGSQGLVVEEYRGASRFYLRGPG